MPEKSGKPATSDEPQRNGLEELLRQRLEETRLPLDLREQILAQLPPPEERERLLRELQKKGGLPSEQFLAALGLEVEHQP